MTRDDIRSARFAGWLLAVGTLTVALPATAGLNVEKDYYSTRVDRQLVVTAPGVLVNDEDDDGSALVVLGVETPPDTGSVTMGSDGGFVYTPAAGFIGEARFKYEVQSATNNAVVDVFVDVVAGDAVPIADALSVTTSEDQSVQIELTGSDPDGDPLTFEVIGGPSSGSLTGSGAILTYTPDSGFHGSDGFTFRVSDGDDFSAPATVAITVDRVNDTPVANGQSLSTDEDTPLGITLTGSDPDGVDLSFEVTGGPSSGSLSGSDNQFVYTPGVNYHGADSFTFVVRDADNAVSAPATVDITVNPVNDAPTANAGSATTDEDTAVTITLTGADVDGDALSIRIGGRSRATAAW
jgi:large repetitive protein